MNYEETLTYLFNSTPVFEHVGASAYKEGLDNSLALDRHLGHPHQQFRSVHIAGTNGKGSTAHTLASILQESGYRVGLYTSPHLVDFRERIRVDGLPISKEYVVDFVRRERPFFVPLHPSFFELTTAMAFQYFAHRRVDIAVVEVGLGGRLDCTNILSPLLSVITNISLDHTGFLGDTLEQIAREKAGIIKPHIPVVIGETTPETRPVFLETAQRNEADIHFAQEEEEVTGQICGTDGQTWLTTRSYGSLPLWLGGSYQLRNANTILCSVNELRRLGIRCDAEAVRRGFSRVCENTGLMGRWQRLQNRPTVICDTGHNVGGWEYLSRQLKAQACRQLRIVFGMVDDKDLDSVLALLPQEARYYFTQAKTHRAIPSRTVKEKAIRRGLAGESYADVPSAYRAALSDANPEDFVFVGGSSYVVADLLTSLASKDDQLAKSSSASR